MNTHTRSFLNTMPKYIHPYIVAHTYTFALTYVSEYMHIHTYYIHVHTYINKKRWIKKKETAPTIPPKSLSLSPSYEP